MLLFLFQLACFPEIKESEEQRFPENPTDDYDDDGFMDAEDCDDSNPEITVPQTYYLDADGDGFGSQTVSELACPSDKSDGYIPAQIRNGVEVFDCDDQDPLVHPDALEVCDQVDNNCLDGIDEYDGLHVNRWYVDADGDGYGYYEPSLEGEVRYSCLDLSGYSRNFLDCDDQDASISPSANEICDGVDNDCNGVIDEPTSIDVSRWYQDNDQDGFGSNLIYADACTAPEGFIASTLDCNDNDGNVHPNAFEVCNNGDDNCNGLVDEGADSTAPMGSVTFYADTDGDGFGDANVSVNQCNSPSGYVTNSDDCNDTAATTYPNATEYCNGLDDDCDGSIDEEDAVDKSPFYADTDADGFGDGSTVQYSCPLNQPTGFVDNLDDCDDTLASVYPNAQEYCNEIDDNCNGGVDEGTDFNAPPDAVTWYYDLDGDGYGNLNNTVLACDAVVGTVSNSDDCDDTRSASRPGAAEYCNELDDDCDGSVDEDAIDRYAYYLDADGDGHGDSTTQVLECPDYSTGLPNPPANASLDGDDCDDGNADISPSAAEQCTPLIDENCDGDTTFGVPLIELPSWYPDSDGDGYGNPTFVIQLCEQPLNYVSNADDCNDTDFYVHPEDQVLHASEFEDDGVTPYVHRERCNGKVDLCENDWNGDLSPPVDESDDDGDGYVECVLDPSTYVVLDTEEDEFNQVHDVITVNNWSDSTVTIIGGDDCDDSDVDAYPGAAESCNGAFENCWDPLLNLQNAPELETDDDGDCFVECYGYDSNIWEGGIHSCEHVDGTGQIIQETVVIGGEDCNDGNPDTYVGAAYNDPTVCAQDADGDGDADCNMVGLVQSSVYGCDFGVDLPNGGMGPDFVLIQGGLEPLGRYTLTNDFYVMTTEVTVGMWSAVMSDGSSESLFAQGGINWFDAIEFANRLSVLTGREECYSTTDLLSDFTSPYDCNGFRLLTDAEWEYAARSGTQYDFWTPDGGGNASQPSGCTGTETIQDGVSNPLLRDYAWYCADPYLRNKEVGQKLPNGFGIYDMHGNVKEWTTDRSCPFPQTSTDPFCSTPFNFASRHYRLMRDRGWPPYPSQIVASFRQAMTQTSSEENFGFRLGLTSP